MFPLFVLDVKNIRKQPEVIASHKFKLVWIDEKVTQFLVYMYSAPFR